MELQIGGCLIKCPATAVFIDNKNLTIRETLGTNSHVDDPNPAFQKASETRQKLKNICMKILGPKHRKLFRKAEKKQTMKCSLKLDPIKR